MLLRGWAMGRSITWAREAWKPELWAQSPVTHCSPLAETHPVRKRARLICCSRSQPQSLLGPRENSQQPTPSDFPCWPYPGDHHQGTKACSSARLVTLLSPKK